MVSVVIFTSFRSPYFNSLLLSFLFQVLYLKVTKGLLRAGWRFLRIPSFHHRLHVRGFREPIIVLGAYLISSVLALLGGYVGLISA